MVLANSQEDLVQRGDRDVEKVYAVARHVRLETPEELGEEAALLHWDAVDKFHPRSGKRHIVWLGKGCVNKRLQRTFLGLASTLASRHGQRVADTVLRLQEEGG